MSLKERCATEYIYPHHFNCHGRCSSNRKRDEPARAMAPLKCVHRLFCFFRLPVGIRGDYSDNNPYHSADNPPHRCNPFLKLQNLHC